MGVLGIDLGGTNLRAGLVENDVLIHIESLELKNDGTEREVIDDLFSLIDRFSKYEICGIGIGVPSIVDTKNGIVYDVQNIPSWKKIHLKEIIETKYHLTVYVNNDANCFVAGEKYFGRVRNYNNIVGLIIGTGLGAGLILNNLMYDGTNCGAGEFGLIPYKDQNYEYYCSGQFFEKKYGISGKELAQKAEISDAKALEIFSEFGSNLGNAINMIMLAVDPEIIVLGGSVSKSYHFFKDEMWKSIKKSVYPVSANRLKVEVSETNHIAILGAAVLYHNALKNYTDTDKIVEMV